MHLSTKRFIIPVISITVVACIVMGVIVMRKKQTQQPQPDKNISASEEDVSGTEEVAAETTTEFTVPGLIPATIEHTEEMTEEPTSEEPTTEEPTSEEPATEEVSAVAPGDKTVDQLVIEVIGGLWGNGKDRKDRLTAAGYSYREVQSAVNAKLGYTEQEID